MKKLFGLVCYVFGIGAMCLSYANDEKVRKKLGKAFGDKTVLFDTRKGKKKAKFQLKQNTYVVETNIVDSSEPEDNIPVQKEKQGVRDVLKVGDKEFALLPDRIKSTKGKNILSLFKRGKEKNYLFESSKLLLSGFQYEKHGEHLIKTSWKQFGDERFKIVVNIAAPQIRVDTIDVLVEKELLKNNKWNAEEVNPEFKRAVKLYIIQYARFLKVSTESDN